MKKLGVVLLLLTFMLCGCGRQNRWQEQYDLGMQYLEEGNYEEAIVAFMAAIEVDGKKPDTYYSLSEAYAFIGDYDMAIQTLENGVNATNSSDIMEYLADFKSRLAYTDENGRIVEEYYGLQETMQEITELFSQEDLEEVRILVGQQESYDVLMPSMDPQIIYFDPGTDERLALYTSNRDTGKKGYLYYGGWNGNVWDGKGYLCWIEFNEESEREVHIYEDEWDNGQPQNMLQTLYSYMKEDNIEAANRFMKQAEYRFVSSCLTEDAFYHYNIDDDKGIGMYYIDNRVFCYYGQWNEYERSGEGVWITPDFAELYIFEGTWSDDAPNGQGIETWTYDSGAEGRAEGTYHNGLWDGEMKLVNYRYGVTECEWTPITANDGILEKITREKCPEVMRWNYDNLPHFFVNEIEGTYIAAVNLLRHANDSDELWVRPNEYYAVEGFYPYN